MLETLGARLRRLRKERGWSGYEAAKRAGMIPFVLYRLETRTALGKVPIASVQRLASIYEVSLDYLVRDVPIDDVADDDDRLPRQPVRSVRGV